MSARESEASCSAWDMTGEIISRCLREAISGTTPPYSAWMATWEDITEERICRPSRTTAAAVSSQDVSIARTSI
jgi:hypothetical protein